MDWLMNEGGDLERVRAVMPMIGKNTRLITCRRNDPTKVVLFSRCRALVFLQGHPIAGLLDDEGFAAVRLA